MNKTIIANWGHSKQGKSQTIKLVAELILNKYPNATVTPTEYQGKKDIKIIITIGTVKIGIESTGDPNSRLFQSLDEFTNANCDVIICATRTSGETEKAVLALQNTYKILWVTNLRSEQFNSTRLNEISANYIVNIFDEILSGNLR